MELLLGEGLKTPKLQKNQIFANKRQSELKTLEWDILNPDRIINLEINNKRRTSII